MLTSIAASEPGESWGVAFLKGGWAKALVGSGMEEAGVEWVLELDMAVREWRSLARRR